MPDEEPPVPDEILTSAKAKLEQDDLSLADNEEILHALSELTPVYEHDRSYFVLGNYDREPIRRLNLVVDRLNRRPNAYAFRMVDVRGEWDNSIQKFCFKREYEDEDHPFGWMQDGVFELFEREERLYRWRTEADLVEATGELP